jgi:hypothetical protein
MDVAFIAPMQPCVDGSSALLAAEVNKVESTLDSGTSDSPGRSDQSREALRDKARGEPAPDTDPACSLVSKSESATDAESAPSAPSPSMSAKNIGVCIMDAPAAPIVFRGELEPR